MAGKGGGGGYGGGSSVTNIPGTYVPGSYPAGSPSVLALGTQFDSPIGSIVVGTFPMGEERKARVPVKTGYFTVPDHPGDPPKLLGTRCEDCGEHFFPRRVVCARCLSTRTAGVELGPRGTLYSYTFVHFPLFGSTRVEHVGYGVGQIDLPEGPRVQFPLAGKQDDYRIGMTLEAELEPIRDEGSQEVVILRFRPVGEP